MKNDIKQTLAGFCRDERAVSSVEYALLSALIAVVCVAAMVSLGGNLNALYQNVCNQVNAAVGGALGC